MRDYILIVSDNRQTLNAVFKYVNTAFKLLIASTKEEAEELLKDQEYEISVVLLEEDVFGQDVFKVMADLQSVTYIPHYIVLIKERKPELITKIMQNGAFDCVVKPILAEELIQKIEGALRLKEIYNKISKNAEKMDMESKEKEVFQALLYEQLMKQRLKTDILDIQDTLDFAAMIQNHAEIDAVYEGKKLKERIRDRLFGKTKAKILIVEDEEDYQAYLSSMLMPIHDVVLAGNAVDGIHLAEKEEDLDVILLDIRMPYLDGTDAVALFKKKRPEAAIIMLTASEETLNIVRALREGASEYCIKPIIPEDLLSKIGKALEEKFYPKVIDEMVNEVQEKHISEHRRELMFEALCKKRKEEERPILLEELQLFFPKLNINRAQSKQFLPEKVLKEGVGRFLSSMI